jgi:DNA-binding transcriptional ArsR family regulator
MTVEPHSVARFAGVLADPTRMAMCLALVDGRSWTAGELARHVGVSASTATEHLNALVNAEILAEQRSGRHRYLRIANPQVGQLIEDLAALSGTLAPPPQSLRAARVAAEMEFARTCYDHLAGLLGVALCHRLEELGYIETSHGASVTSDGEQWIKSLGLDVDLSTSRRPAIRVCLDWTERLQHVGGLTGAIIHRYLMENEWITQRAGQRAVRVTRKGEDGLYDELGLDVRALRGS